MQQLSNRDFNPIISEKLKNLGYDFNHNLVEGSRVENIATEFFKTRLNRKTKGRKPFVKEFDYRAHMTQDTLSLDQIVAKFDMTQYRAEMYELILNQTLNHLLQKNLIQPTDNRTYGPGRIFVKGD